MSNSLLFSNWQRRRVSFSDGLVPLVKVIFGLGMAGADGIVDFSLKRSGVGQDGHCGESE